MPSLQQTPLNKHQSATANHGPGKPDKLLQHTIANQTSYPSMHSKRDCIKGLQKPRTEAVAVGVRRDEYKKTSREGAEPATTTQRS